MSLADGALPRPLTDEERTLARWLLEHGGPDARPFLEQLDRATATTWECPCGCASFDFLIAGRPPAPVGIRVLSDYVVDDELDPAGVIIYESGGTLGGVEVFGYGQTPAGLPKIADLRPFPRRQDGPS